MPKRKQETEAAGSVEPGDDSDTSETGSASSSGDESGDDDIALAAPGQDPPKITMRQALRRVLSKRKWKRGVTVGAILNSLYFRVSSEGADKASIKEDAYNVLKNSEEFKSVNKKGGQGWKLLKDLKNPKGVDGGLYVWTKRPKKSQAQAQQVKPPGPRPSSLPQVGSFITMRQLLREVLLDSPETGTNAAELFPAVYALVRPGNVSDRKQQMYIRRDAKQVMKKSEEFNLEKRGRDHQWHLNKDLLQGEPKGIDGGTYVLIS